ncbi:FAD-dependent oxidoreductase [Roseivirga sp.]|uniref:FAD-dependent oxidoreductase n=1 Tax=Roseivirga sp. TaxID=1964215 RepID=UPI003B51E4B2
MDKKITILGAGLVGSLLSIFLSKRGYQVNTYESRPDPRKADLSAGRSINLALSHRGLKGLHAVGLANEVKERCIPMPGRMIHDLAGDLNFQPYGKEGQYINSVSRSGLNELLLDKAEEAGAKIYFDYKCIEVDYQLTQSRFLHDGQELTISADFIFGADGAFSAMRNAFMRTDRFNYQQHYITAGYKELHIPPTDSGEFAIDPNALHIWPRGKFMLIALPNLDKSFTVTLFLPFEGEKSFEKLQDENSVRQFFQEEFADAVPLMPDLLHDFFTNPTSSLVTVRCYPWVKENCALIGDAAHAIVPFYGQGMNAGFEDCFVLDQLLEQHGELNQDLLARYQELRKPDGEAIADLALYNFIEMRDKVADPQFILQKKIEKRLNELYPDQWLPLYPMVTFSDLRYSEALAIGRKQQSIMDKVLADPEVESRWENLDFASIVAQL